MNGRKIEVVTKDDAYDPAKTVQNVQELTQSDQVFALFNIVGTPNNEAIRDTLADRAPRTSTSRPVHPSGARPRTTRG